MAQNIIAFSIGFALVCVGFALIVMAIDIIRDWMKDEDKNVRSRNNADI